MVQRPHLGRQSSPTPEERQGQRHRWPLLPYCSVTSLHLSALISERRAAPCTLSVCEGNRTLWKQLVALGVTQHGTREVKASLTEKGLEAWLRAGGL